MVNLVLRRVGRVEQVDSLVQMELTHLSSSLRTSSRIEEQAIMKASRLVQQEKQKVRILHEQSILTS